MPIANENDRISGSSLGPYLEVTIEAVRKRYAKYREPPIFVTVQALGKLGPHWRRSQQRC